MIAHQLQSDTRMYCCISFIWYTSLKSICYKNGLLERPFCYKNLHKTLSLYVADVHLSTYIRRSLISSDQNYSRLKILDYSLASFNDSMN